MSVSNKQIHEELLKLKEDLRDIKIRLLDPDSGTISKVNKNTSFRKTARIWLGVFFATTIGIVTKMLLKK